MPRRLTSHDHVHVGRPTPCGASRCYLNVGLYAHLACPDWIDVLGEFRGKGTSSRGIAALLLTAQVRAVVEGCYLLRGCIVNFRTDETDVRAIPEIVVRMGVEVLLSQLLVQPGRAD